MFTRAAVSVVVAVGLAALAGCGPGKLDETKTYSLDPKVDSARALDLPAQPKPQTVTVEYTSSDDEIDIGLYKAADVDAELFVRASKALKAEKGKAGTFTAAVPENTATRVVVTVGMKKTDVKLHVTNKK